MVADLRKSPPAGDKNGDEAVRHVSAREDSPLDRMQFRHPLRRYQQEIIELVNLKLERGERELHIVAPPGAGKTIIGLQIISQLRCPSLILAPNTTIQAQWSQKLDLFIPDDEIPFATEELIGTHEDKPLKPITVLTYQVLSTPGREQEYLDKLAHQSWVKELTGAKSLSTGEAELRIMELMQKNPYAYKKEISRHTSRLRRWLTEVMDLNDVLHDNALALLQALRRQKFKLVIFDECHHLTDYWAAVMTHLVKRLDDPVVVGLTGTPPEGKSATQETRYLKLVGEIDYQVPTPALVKEGGLAPFQDLVFFTTPTEAETDFLERQHDEFHCLIEELITPPGQGQVPRLTAWVLRRLDEAHKNGWHE
ncbi:MAG TPA: DEAD/DEAH box helicase family protein, partial [Candidatus Obscuribacterales bacterium]